jgi:hypothetical protein
MGIGSDSAIRRAHPVLFGSIVLFSLIEVSPSFYLQGARLIGLIDVYFGVANSQI